VSSSSLISILSRYLDAAGVARGPGRERVSLAAEIARRVTDLRDRRGIRHALAAGISVVAGGLACGHRSPQVIAKAAADWDQEVLAGHGCRISPVTGLRVPPSASTLARLGDHIDPDELERALSSLLAEAALSPQMHAAARDADRWRRADGKNKDKRKRRPRAGEDLRGTRQDGQVRAAPGHPWIDPAVLGDPGHVPACRAVAVDGKERRGAKAAGRKKVHLLGAVTHDAGLVIGQDKVAKKGKANEVTHFRPLLENLPLDGVTVTSDAMQATRDNARFLRHDKHAHYLWPVLGNQPGLYAMLDALDWENTPVAAATIETGKGRVETRAIQVLPVPDGTGFAGAARAVLIERYVTIKKNGQWVMRNCEAVLYITSLADRDATAGDLLALIRGHWRVEHAHWLRDVVWEEDESLIRAGNRPQVMTALTNLVLTLFRLHGVTEYAEETRRCARQPRRTLQFLHLPAPSPG
jgi:predicted transposase YbfD/YdcC